MDSRGYIYARFWSTESSLPYDLCNPEDSEKVRNQHLTRVVANSSGDIDLEYDFTFDILHLIVAIGQTKHGLHERYANEKSPSPIKEWSALVNNPKSQEDKLRQSFKSFLSNRLYELAFTNDREIQWIDSSIMRWAQSKGEQLIRTNIFMASRQISIDMFDIPCILVGGGRYGSLPFPHSLRLNQEILILTFFNAYFDSLHSQGISTSKQGTLI